MLLNYEVVPPSDVKNILRVLAIQASAPRTEFQLKILQVRIIFLLLVQFDATIFVLIIADQYLNYRIPIM